MKDRVTPLFGGSPPAVLPSPKSCSVTFCLVAPCVAFGTKLPFDVARYIQRTFSYLLVEKFLSHLRDSFSVSDGALIGPGATCRRSSSPPHQPPLGGHPARHPAARQGYMTVGGG